MKKNILAIWDHKKRAILRNPAHQQIWAVILFVILFTILDLCTMPVPPLVILVEIGLTLFLYWLFEPEK